MTARIRIFSGRSAGEWSGVLKIGEAAKRVGLPIKTVRHYADIGLVRPAEVRESGYRDYGEPELRRLRMVARARVSGFSLDECRLLMELIDDPSSAPDAAMALALTKRAELDRQLAELLSLRSTLDQLIAVRERGAPQQVHEQEDMFGAPRTPGAPATTARRRPR